MKFFNNFYTNQKVKLTSGSYVLGLMSGIILMIVLDSIALHLMQ